MAYGTHDSADGLRSVRQHDAENQPASPKRPAGSPRRPILRERNSTDYSDIGTGTGSTSSDPSASYSPRKRLRQSPLKPSRAPNQKADMQPIPLDLDEALDALDDDLAAVEKLPPHVDHTQPGFQSIPSELEPPPLPDFGVTPDSQESPPAPSDIITIDTDDEEAEELLSVSSSIKTDAEVLAHAARISAYRTLKGTGINHPHHELRRIILAHALQRAGYAVNPGDQVVLPQSHYLSSGERDANGSALSEALDTPAMSHYRDSLQAHVECPVTDTNKFDLFHIIAVPKQKKCRQTDIELAMPTMKGFGETVVAKLARILTAAQANQSHTAINDIVLVFDLSDSALSDDGTLKRSATQHSAQKVLELLGQFFQKNPDYPRMRFMLLTKSRNLYGPNGHAHIYTAEEAITAAKAARTSFFTPSPAASQATATSQTSQEGSAAPASQPTPAGNIHQFWAERRAQQATPQPVARAHSALFATPQNPIMPAAATSKRLPKKRQAASAKRPRKLKHSPQSNTLKAYFTLKK